MVGFAGAFDQPRYSRPGHRANGAPGRHERSARYVSRNEDPCSHRNSIELPGAPALDEGASRGECTSGNSRTRGGKQSATESRAHWPHAVSHAPSCGPPSSRQLAASGDGGWLWNAHDSADRPCEPVANSRVQSGSRQGRRRAPRSRGCRARSLDVPRSPNGCVRANSTAPGSRHGPARDLRSLEDR